MGGEGLWASRWRRGAAAAVVLALCSLLSQSWPRTAPGPALGRALVAQEPRWDPSPVYTDLETSECTIERVAYDALTPARFFAEYEEKRPVILSYDVATELRRNRRFEEATRKHALLERHGKDEITLSTGNRNSYAKRLSTVAAYIRDDVRPQQESVPGNVSWYHFGDPHHLTWAEVRSVYEPPTKFMHPQQQPALSFGFAGSGTGVPFHTHGAVFAEVLHGRKRWWLSAPSAEPRFDPDDNTLSWLRNVRPTYSPVEALRLLDCVCERGDVIYIPSFWHHATLNIGETVFMSVFL